MATLPTEWESMGGRRLRKVVDSPLGSLGDTITYPLRAPLGAGTSGVYTVERWTNTGAGDFPSNLGARLATIDADTLDEALTAVPV